MRKILSVVLAVLMVSMISTVSFAATAGIEDITGLVAGETFTVTPNSEATISVNAKVFDIVAVEGNGDGSIEAYKAAAGEAVEIKVGTSIPKEFTSQIKVNDEFVNVTIKDRLLGDANGDGFVTSADATMMLINAAGGENEATFKLVAGDINADGYVTSADATQALIYAANGTPEVAGIGTAYLGGNSADAVEDPWTAEPEVQKLAAPTGVYAYHQNGTVYFTFDSVESATSYDVKVGDGEAQNFTATSGSISATYAEGLKITVVAKAEGFDSSDAAEANVVDATVSGELATWLENNGLSDVAITVYEITE